MKKLLLATLVMVFMLVTVQSSYAANLYFELDKMWDWGRLYNLSGPTWTPQNTNPYDSSTGESLTNGVAKTSGPTSEDSFGITRISYMEVDGVPVFDLTSPFELTVMFGGFDDVLISGLMDDADILANGGFVKVFKDYDKDYKGTSASTVPEPGTGRTGYAAFDSVTDGELVLDLTPYVRYSIPYATNYTFSSNFNFNSPGGSGDLFADVIGGSWMSAFDTDMISHYDPAYGVWDVLGADIFINFESNSQNMPTGTDWVVRGTGSGNAVVPEPTSMALLGMGLLGLVGFKRKRS